MTDIQIYKAQLPAKQENFVVQFTPAKCLLQFSKVNSPALCVSSGVPSLATIRKQYSPDFVVAYIALWIDNLNDFINANRKMTPAQMEETAVILFQEYHYLNLADINLVFRRIKKGEFGMLFSEIDGVKILGWFELYAQERMHAAADAQYNEHLDHTTDNHPRTREKREAEKVANIRAKGFHTLQGG